MKATETKTTTTTTPMKLQKSPVTQNGASQIDSNHVNAMHHNNQRHLNGDSYRKSSTMAGNRTAGTGRITDIDQHTNPFVFKVQMSLPRKIMVRLRWNFVIFLGKCSESPLHKIQISKRCFSEPVIDTFWGILSDRDSLD